MTGSMNELHPTPNAEVLAGMEMQPGHYDVISIGAAYSREDPVATEHARAQIVFGIGRAMSRDEINALILDAIADLHAFLEEKDRVRMVYQPGAGPGPYPADTAMPAAGPHPFGADTEPHHPDSDCPDTGEKTL